MTQSAGRWPFIQWFVQDWLSDPLVSQCSPATRGVLFDWLCNMHLLDRSGQITGTRAMLARLGRCTPVDVDTTLQELQLTNAATVTERNAIVTVINRRMKREHLQRKSGAERAERHRRNAQVTPHNQSQIPEPEIDLRENSQSNRPRPSCPKRSGAARTLTTLTLDRLALDRIAAALISPENEAFYDNCKVKAAHFPKRQSLITVLEPFAGRVEEPRIQPAWAEAVKRTHKASVDGLITGTVAGYCIACFRELLEKESHG